MGISQLSRTSMQEFGWRFSEPLGDLLLERAQTPRRLALKLTLAPGPSRGQIFFLFRDRNKLRLGASPQRPLGPSGRMAKALRDSGRIVRRWGLGRPRDVGERMRVPFWAPLGALCSTLVKSGRRGSVTHRRRKPRLVQVSSIETSAMRIMVQRVWVLEGVCADCAPALFSRGIAGVRDRSRPFSLADTWASGERRSRRLFFLLLIFGWPRWPDTQPHFPLPHVALQLPFRRAPASAWPNRMRHSA